jgi:hypothetical protein
MSLYLSMLLVLGVFKISSQNPDFFVSYAAREGQIISAKKYNKEVKESFKNFLEYTAINMALYEEIPLGTTRPSSYKLNVPKNPCYGIIWRYFKPITSAITSTRCDKKIRLLKAVEKLLNEIQTSPTLYRPKSAVSSRIMVKKNAILKNMNIELLKH